jgi:NPCBM/NEW2 domain
MPGGSVVDRERSRLWDIFLVILGSLVLAIIAGVIVNAINGSSSTSAAGSQSKILTPTESIDSPSPTPSRSAQQPTSSVQKTMTTPPVRTPQFLSDAQFGDTNTANVGTGDIGIGKQDYPSSVWLCSDLELLANINCQSKPSPYWVDYNIPGGYSSFKATIGFSTNSPSNCDVTVQIFGDGTELYSQEIYYGDSIPITRRVAKYLRIRLQIVPHKGLMCAAVFGNAEFLS